MLDRNSAAELIKKDSRNRSALFPYINGHDLNSRPDASAGRWIINFDNWPEERARTYPELYDQVLRLVKPERDKNNRKVRRDLWWQYAERAPNLYAALAGLERVIVIAQVSKTVMPMVVPTGQVFDQKLIVFATRDPAILALLSSAQHYHWAVKYGSTMKTDLNYSPSDVFITFPQPAAVTEMERIGVRLDVFRRDVMMMRRSGLTATYNLVNSKECNDADIEELRAIHKTIDVAVCRAYGWDDLIPQLGHGIHPVGRDTRFTVGPAVQRELVDRLLELNHERYAAEVAAGLHEKKTKKTARATAPKATSRKPRVDPGQSVMDI
jgi:hypothetical protein